MLEHTFCHIPGIGPKREERIWNMGLTSWDIFLEHKNWPEDDSLLQKIPFSFAYEHILNSKIKLNKRDLIFFYSALPSSESWRLFFFPGVKTGYLDIETTGLGNDAVITTMVLYSGQKIRHYVEGINLNDFKEHIQECELLVTYNGKSFDLPFITRQMGIEFHKPHIDLRFLLADLGYRGGLKGCERALGINREGLKELDGYHAVILWKEYIRSLNPVYLETLLSYNMADTVNLETLLIMACNLKLKKLEKLKLPSLPFPDQPEMPFRPDSEAVIHVKNLGQGSFR